MFTYNHKSNKQDKYGKTNFQTKIMTIYLISDEDILILTKAFLIPYRILNKYLSNQFHSFIKYKLSKNITKIMFNSITFKSYTATE